MTSSPPPAPAPGCSLRRRLGSALVWLFPVAMLLWWWTETSDMPWSLIDHGEYFWRARELRGALGRGDLGDAIALVFERRHPFEVPLGRMRPFLWTYVSAFTSISEAVPAAFNAFSGLVFAATVALTGRIVLSRTRSVVLAVCAEAILGLATTSTAMWLRVGCHEAPLALLGGGAFAVALTTPAGATVRLRSAAAAVLIVLCVATKETSVHLAPLLVGSWWLLGRDSGNPARERVVRMMSLAGLAAITALVGTYLVVAGSREAGSYSSGYVVSWDVLTSRAALLLRWISGDFLALAVVVPASAAVRLVRARRHGPLAFEDRVTFLLLVECLAYLAIYLPWTNLPERVLPGFSFTFAILSATEAREWMRLARGTVPTARLAARAALVLCGLSLARGLIDWPLASHREATFLRARYRCDAALVDRLARGLPPSATVYFDLPDERQELGVGASLHLALWKGRADVRHQVSGLGHDGTGASLVAAYMGHESEPGRAARAADTPPERIAVGADAEFWTVWNVLRSSFHVIRRGSWPGVPHGRREYFWLLWPGSTEGRAPK